MIKIIPFCLTLAFAGLVGCTVTTSNDANLRNANTNTGYVVNSNESVPARTSTPINVNSSDGNSDRGDI